MTQDPEKLVDAILKISRAFLPERIVYMIGAGGGVILLLVLAFLKLGDEFDLAVASAIFGAGGLFAGTAVGVLRAFDKTLATVRDLLVPPDGGR